MTERQETGISLSCETVRPLMRPTTKRVPNLTSSDNPGGAAAISERLSSRGSDNSLGDAEVKTTSCNRPDDGCPLPSACARGSRQSYGRDGGRIGGAPRLASAVSSLPQHDYRVFLGPCPSRVLARRRRPQGFFRSSGEFRDLSS